MKTPRPLSRRSWTLLTLASGILVLTGAVYLLAERRPSATAMDDLCKVKEKDRARSGQGLVGLAREGLPIAGKIAAEKAASRDSFDRRAAAEALAKIDTPQSLAILGRLAADPRPDVRRAALRALEQKRPEDAWPVLRRLLATRDKAIIGPADLLQIFRLGALKAPAQERDSLVKGLWALQVGPHDDQLLAARVEALSRVDAANPKFAPLLADVLRRPAETQSAPRRRFV